MAWALTCDVILASEEALIVPDFVDALDAMQRPTILVIQQKWPPELHNKAGLAGEMMDAANGLGAAMKKRRE